MASASARVGQKELAAVETPDPSLATLPLLQTGKERKSIESQRNPITCGVAVCANLSSQTIRHIAAAQENSFIASD
jgi:hypothetical protein